MSGCVRWVSWVVNDAGLLSTWHALAADGATTLCGRAVPVPRIHKLWHLPALQPHHGPACRKCNAAVAEAAAIPPRRAVRS